MHCHTGLILCEIVALNEFFLFKADANNEVVKAKLTCIFLHYVEIYQGHWGLKKILNTKLLIQLLQAELKKLLKGPKIKL